MKGAKSRFCSMKVANHFLLHEGGEITSCSMKVAKSRDLLHEGGEITPEIEGADHCCSMKVGRNHDLLHEGGEITCCSMKVAKSRAAP